MSKGRDLPDWYLDCPVLLPGEEIYYEAFWILNTCRPSGFSIGYIPWTAIRQYVDELQLDAEVTRFITKVIMAFDVEYVKQENDKIERSMKKSSKPAAPTKPQRRSIKK